MIDEDGFRANICIVLINDLEQVFWAKRIEKRDAWQFPQGGIKSDEATEAAMFRELREEIGLLPQHVTILGCTKDWLRYELPSEFIRHYSKPLCIGQKQIWYLLKLTMAEENIDLQCTDEPEFDRWKWVKYCYPVQDVIDFKKNVYHQALKELESFLPSKQNC